MTEPSRHSSGILFDKHVTSDNCDRGHGCNSDLLRLIPTQPPAKLSSLDLHLYDAICFICFSCYTVNLQDMKCMGPDTDLG